MSPEQKHPKAGIRKNICGKIAEQLLSRTERRLFDPIRPEFPEGFKEALIEAMANPNAIPIVYSNHYDHANGAEMAVVSKILTHLINTARDPENQFKGFALVISSSLKDGKQNLLLQEFLEQAERNYFPKFNLSTIECATENDIKKRHESHGINRDYFHRLGSLAERGNEGIEIFPEGSVEGGRYTGKLWNRHVKGMQKFNSEGLDIIARIIMEKNGKEIVYIPLTLEGPNRIHTNHKIPTLLTIRTLYLTRNPKSLVSVKVGMPINHAEVIRRIKEKNGQEEITPEEISDYLARLVVSLLPSNHPHLKGVYA